MGNDYTEMEIIRHYHYMGKEYYLEIFYSEGLLTKAFASFQCDVDLEMDETIGMGEDDDKNTTIIKAIKHLHSQYH